MRVILLFAFVLFGACSSAGPIMTSKAKNSISGGNSSDVIKALFSDARQKAITIVSAYDEAVWPNETDVTKFMRDNDILIAQEVNAMPFDWASRNTSVCATTNDEKGSPIFFDYANCKASVKSEMDAVRIIIHEAIHHFGVGSSPEDERFADVAAGAFIKAYELSQNLIGNLHGSIAYSPQNGALFFALNWSSQATSERKVNGLCKGQCTQIRSAYNTCLALYSDPENPAKFSWWDNPDQQVLEKRTKQHCDQSFSTNCKKVYSGCTKSISGRSNVPAPRSPSEPILLPPKRVTIYSGMMRLDVNIVDYQTDLQPINIYNNSSSMTVNIQRGQFIEISAYNSEVQIAGLPDVRQYIRLVQTINSHISY
ncbi:MAG: DUF4189 domain-containing protein [Proteobacteria bacterium]|nr:DUF4189 domain-containing protein [Pseudomonadota bacterium]